MAKMETGLPQGLVNAGKSLRECAALFSRERIQSIASQRISTGFPVLDRSLNGGLSNGLYVLGAVPGLGKSTLALQIAYNLSSQGIPVLYFALEMSRAWITAKSICRADFALHRQTGFQAADLLDSRKAESFSEAQWDRINQAREVIEQEGRHLYLYEQGPSLSHIGHIQEHIRAFREAHHQDYGDRPIMVVVDYLQILAPRDTLLKATDKQIVDDNVRELCNMRDQQNVIILLISALNRGSYDRGPTLSSFKESGSIEYSADVILGMQYQGNDDAKFSQEAAKAQNPRQLELTLLKMRYGQDGIRIPLLFYSENSYFQQPDGGGQTPQVRLQELRKMLGAYPVQYHDGFHRKARRRKG